MTQLVYFSSQVTTSRKQNRFISSDYCEMNGNQSLTHTVHTQLVTGIGGIRQMTKIPACSWNSHPTPPLLRLRVLLLWSIDSLHFYSRNPSAAYQQLTFPRTLPIPAPHDPGFLAPYSRCDSSLKENNVPVRIWIPHPPQIRISIYR